jgi:hypothetical protein
MAAKSAAEVSSVKEPAPLAALVAEAVRGGMGRRRMDGCEGSGDRRRWRRGWRSGRRCRVGRSGALDVDRTAGDWPGRSVRAVPRIIEGRQRRACVHWSTGHWLYSALGCFGIRQWNR